MKTLIDIDDDLPEKAMEISNSKTKKETIHTALQELIRAHHRKRLIPLSGSGSLALSLVELKQLRQGRNAKHGLN